MLLLTGLALANTSDRQETQVVAQGDQSAVFSIPTFGRYALSGAGADLTLIDRMTGSIQHGADRLDAFLERGEYKLDARFPADGTGDTDLAVITFTELQPTPLPLQPLQPTQTTLHDLEQRSWWLELTTAQTVRVEAAGRHLASLDLWQDGEWLVPAPRTCDTTEPVTGQPWARCWLEVRVEPGVYRLTASGGPSAPWPSESAAAPLFVQWDVPQLARAGRTTGTLPACGYVRYRTSGRYARLDLPANADASLSRGGSYALQSTVSITDQSRTPSAVIRGGDVLTVSGSPGQDYTLTWFDPAPRRTTLRGNGAHYLTTLSADEDHVDLTAVVYRRTDSATIRSNAHALPLTHKHRFADTVMVEGTTELLIEPQRRGSWRFEAPGARLSVEPFLTSTPAGFEAPEPTADALDLDLDPGLYVLTLTVDEPDTLDLSIAPRSWAGWARGALGALQPVFLRPGIQQSPLALDRGAPLTLELLQTGVESGVVLRELPLDLDVDAVPVHVRPGEDVSLPARASVAGSLLADGDVLLEPAHVVAGEAFTFTVHNPGDVDVLTSVRLVPDVVEPVDVDVTPRDLPVLATRPRFLDLDDDDTATWSVSVDAPALYRVESTGLLATTADLRTRTRTGFATGDRNGVGRNFLVQRYLRPGDYRLDVQTVGASAGHLGLTLSSTPVRHGGQLRAGVPARTTVDLGEAVSYDFELSEATDVHLRSLGRGQTFACRLEDADGWPVFPQGDCDVEEHLAPGTYRVILFPADLATRRLTLLDVEEAPADPDVLALDGTVTGLWTEAAPTSHSFTLTAAATTTLTLSEAMYGEVFRGRERVARITPGTPWSGRLDAGDYVVKLRPARADDHVPYELSLDVRELVPGLSRTVFLPDTIEVSVEDGLVELSSFGTADIRAELLGPDGVIASNDDRPGDWNFRIATSLEAGTYDLRLRKIGEGPNQTTVTVERPRVVTHGAIERGRSLTVGDDVHVVPLAVDPASDVVVLDLTSEETLDAALEAKVGGTWKTLASGGERLIARGPVQAWRARIRSLDPRGNPLRMRVHVPEVQRVDEERLEDGVRLGGLVGAVGTHVADSGVFTLSGPLDGLVQCPAAGQGCVPATPTLAVTGHGLLLAGTGSVHAERRILSHPLSLPVDPAVQLDLPGNPGPVAVIARATSGQPGAALPDGGIGIADGAAIAVDPSGLAEKVTVWTDAPDTEVRMEPHAFPPPETLSLALGVHDRSLAAGDALHVDTPEGSSARISLQPGLAVVSGDVVHWAHDAGLQAWLPNGDDLTLLNFGDADALWSLELVRDADAPYVATAHPFERVFTRAGSVALPVRGSSGATLDLAGAVRDAVFVGVDGRIARWPAALTIDVDGTLLLTHATGAVVVHTDAGLWGTAQTVPAPASLPSTTALSGTSAALQVDVEGARMLHLRTPGPLVLKSVVDGVARTSIVTDGTDLWMPAGSAELHLRALDGARLSGALELSATAPTLIGEGRGPEVLLAPGATRVFRFDLPRPGRIGLGVAAAADLVSATLFDQSGTSRRESPSRLATLSEGTWLLALSVPADADGPVAARPAIVGLDAPDDGPPPSVVRSFVGRP